MVNEISFSDSEKNFAMGVVDSIMCFLGLLTGGLGMWIDGLNVFFVFLIFISVLMGVAASVRFSRERNMSTSDLPSPWRTP